MKTKMLKITTIALLLAVGGASCTEKGESGNFVSIQYLKCECDREVQYRRQTSEKNILLLDAEKVTYDELPWFSENSKEIKYVICDFSLKVASFKIYPKPNWLRVAYICNFPFDSSWDIPKEGIFISFTAEEFESCKGWSPNPETSCSDIVLTSLKIQTK